MNIIDVRNSYLIIFDAVGISLQYIKWPCSLFIAFFLDKEYNDHNYIIEFNPNPLSTPLTLVFVVQRLCVVQQKLAWSY